MKKKKTKTGAGSSAAQQQTDNPVVNVFGANHTTVAWVKHNGREGWWRIKVMHNPESVSYAQTTLFVIGVDGEITGTNQLYIDKEHRGVTLPGEWSHKAARAAAELIAETPVEYRLGVIENLVRERNTLTVSVTVHVDIDVRAYQLNYGVTREQIAADVRETVKKAADAHLERIGVLAK